MTNIAHHSPKAIFGILFYDVVCRSVNACTAFITVLMYPSTSVPQRHSESIAKVITYLHLAIDSMKYIFVPISTLGCGKSTTFRILRGFFPQWAHIENDSCSSKRQFYTNIETALETTNVVLLDRNNHLVNHRKEISEHFLAENVKLVALIFVDVNTPHKKLWSTTYDRIKSRGDNHQNIKSSTQAGLTKMVMNKFIKQFELFNITNEGDRDLYPLQMCWDGQSSMENAKRILEFLHKEDTKLVPEIPTKEKLQELFEEALKYTVPECDFKNKGIGNRGSRGREQTEFKGGRGTFKGRGGKREDHCLRGQTQSLVVDFFAANQSTVTKSVGINDIKKDRKMENPPKPEPPTNPSIGAEQAD